MTLIPGNIPKPSATREYREQDLSLAYQLIVNARATLFNDAIRNRLGNASYPVYADKIEGYTMETEVSGATGAAKGGLMWTNPDVSTENRSRLIFCFNNKVYMRIIGLSLTVLLYDTGDTAGDDIDFLDGVQATEFGYFVVGNDDATYNLRLLVYSGPSTGAITAFADAGGGIVAVTSVGHGMIEGNTVFITGTTNYNGTFVVQSGGTNDIINITATWVSDDATGTFEGNRMLLTPVTALSPGRFIGIAENRLAVTGVGSQQTSNQFSILEEDLDFDDFTSSSIETGGGIYTGNEGATTALKGIGGYMLVFERQRVGVHEIKFEAQGTGIIKSTGTLRKDLTLDGIGASSPKSVVEVDGIVFFVTPQGDVYQWNIENTRNPLTELTKSFSPILENFDFERAAIGYDYKRKILCVSCAEVQDGSLDTIFLYDFTTQTWSLDNGKAVNQFFWDEIGQQLWGLSSTTNELHKIFDGTYRNDETDIQISVETGMIDGGSDSTLKDFVNNHVIVGAEDSDQEFTFDIFTDQSTEPSLTLAKSAAGLIDVSQDVSGAWGTVGWGGGKLSDASSESSSVQRLHHFNETLVDRFDRISMRISETSAFRTVIGLPTVRYRVSVFPEKSF